MSKHALIIAALAALTGCAAAAQSEPSPRGEIAEHAASVACQVRLTPTRNGLRIEAVAHSADAMAGEYDLVVSKNGPSGSSDVSQGGPFEAPANAHVTLSATEFGVERGDQYRARLVLRDDTGVLCRDERRS